MAASGTIVKACTCKHEFQDERYGRGQRLHILHSKGEKGGETWARCTVCGDDKRV